MHARERGGARGRVHGRSASRAPVRLIVAFVTVLASMALACTSSEEAPQPATATTSTVTATAPAPSATATAPRATFDDPFAYCAAVRDMDAPDARYIGAAVPSAIVQGIRAATGASPDAPAALFERNTSWRCMDGAVYACTVGANLPCWAKADTSRLPSPTMQSYCLEHPDAAFIPAAVTGRETIYAWRCGGREPVVDRQVTEVDARGFPANIWYRLPAPTR